jgi:hypothetical protein
MGIFYKKNEMINSLKTCALRLWCIDARCASILSQREICRDTWNASTPNIIFPDDSRDLMPALSSGNREGEADDEVRDAGLIH